MTSKAFYSWGIALFWAVCFVQVPTWGESFPFSFFGMYSRSMTNKEYNSFSIEVTKDNNDICLGKNELKMTLRNRLRKIFLSEVKNKNRTFKRQAIPIEAVESSEKKEFREILVPRILKFCQVPSGQPVRVQLIYSYWEQLNYERRNTPSQTKVIFDEEVVVP